MDHTHAATAFPRALTELLAVAFAAPGVASERLFHAHRPLRQSFLERRGHQDAGHEADQFGDLDSLRSRADSSDGESSTSSSSSISSRHKCSLAFILASPDEVTNDASASCSGNQPVVAPMRQQQKSFSPVAPRRIRIPNESASLSVSNSASPSSSAMAAAALNSHTPTSEHAKVKRRRVTPSGKPTKSCKLKTSGASGVAGSGSSRDAAVTTAAAMSSASASATPTAANTNSSSTPVKKGSKYCIVEGCGSRAKHARRCWKHGGSVKCKVADCANRAKTKGVCWSHGGGTICSFANCGTISVSNGVCWAHGGGKRCAIEGCARPAYERTENLCSLHFDDKSKILSGAAAAVMVTTVTKSKAGRAASR